MYFFKTVGCFICFCLSVQCIYAQAVQSPVFYPVNLLFGNTQYIKTDSGLIVNYYNKKGCKNYSVKTKFIPNYINLPPKKIEAIMVESPSPKLISIHGNISYDFFYRSKTDTPFIQHNLQQHTERVWLDIVIKEKYPFKVGFTARQSNSPFLRDLFNMNLNFDKYSYDKNVKQNLLTRLNTIKWQNPDLKRIDSTLNEQLHHYENLKNWVNGPEALQRIIEEREKNYSYNQNKKIPLDEYALTAIPEYRKIKFNNGQFNFLKLDSIKNSNKGNISSKIDSIFIAKKEANSPQHDSSFFDTLEKKKAALNKLEKSIALLKFQSDSLKKSISQNISKARQSINKAANPHELDKIAEEYGISELKKEKMQNFLSNVKTLSIGRSMVDYTELTVQNVMLTGLNVEYNPTYYLAFAGGKIDYGFRDFFGRGIKQKNQYLLSSRMGWCYKDKRSVIFTVFNGRKNNYPGLLATDSNTNTAQLFGYSVEAIFKKNNQTFISAELAKSTKGNNAPSQLPGNKPDNLFRFSDLSNLGLNFKAQTAIPETDTRFSGFFRKTGEAFQSFSLFTYNTNQQAWQLRADQSFLKRKINVTAMLRQNDFTNPLTDKTFKTSTIFKSLQLNVRVPHWPTLNAGYYPGTQFYIVDNNTVRENAYYILNGAVLHAYRVKEISMNSSFIFNRYFNQATDSGFVLYKGTNYILSQSLLIKKLQLESSYSYNKLSELNYYTLDANGDYSVESFLRIGGGVKYNYVLSSKGYWGESVRVGVTFKKLGGLQLHYEKSYLPTIQQTLYPVEIGRVSWYKTF